MGVMAKNSKDAVFRIIFVCTGNICRSPMAEVIFRDMVEKLGLGSAVSIASAGTGEWHVGEKADPRTQSALERAGFTAENHRAKQFEVDWFDTFDLIVTFDRGQRRILKAWASDDEQRSLVQPLLTFHPAPPGGITEVPDPYYGNDQLFDHVRDMITSACEELLRQIEPVVRSALTSRAGSSSSQGAQ
ncbi:low molecular weight phosphotyrosine protein phosphatase [Pseudoclavibacter terrae]|uniref:protein-tyrosine-phosphatase n=2 Tax=Microbacteriaceae TaxID=85023 RepID=A0A7J5B1T1_9MICO|nr:low molecular weight protein-tyrosine-phosphatase [Pseudoclavibacter terrae]KAB1637888.1 low molecular weight phosphotyrosine protein phosphatase [Pseudoclavibacter terrae]PPG38106.1 protein tyrosine phosphatase [Pseudoclavibacter sp. RFBA6]